jgi:hypothetical protein
MSTKYQPRREPRSWDKIANNMPTDPTLASIGQPKPKTPWDWAFLLVFGLPLAIIAGLIFRIRRFRRRRAIAVPATGGLPPTMVVEPADIPIGMNYADTVAKAGPASGATPTDGRPRQPAGQPPDHLQAWRALPPGQRKSIIGGAVVLALFALFVILRPTNFGGATETETLRRAVTDGAWALHEESLDGQPQKPDEGRPHHLARVESPHPFHERSAGQGEGFPRHIRGPDRRDQCAGRHARWQTPLNNC